MIVEYIRFAALRPYIDRIDEMRHYDVKTASAD